MNEMTETKEMERQGWLMGLLAAVVEKLVSSFCQQDMHLSPYEAQFMSYHSVNWEEARSHQYLPRINRDRKV